MLQGKIGAPHVIFLEVKVAKQVDAPVIEEIILQRYTSCHRFLMGPIGGLRSQGKFAHVGSCHQRAQEHELCYECLFHHFIVIFVGLFLEYDLAGGKFVGSINDLQQILPLRYWIVTLVVTHIDCQRQPIALDTGSGVEFAC